MSKTLTKFAFPLLIVSLIALIYTLVSPMTVGQSAPDTVFSGYAWSSNIGWISLNCDQSVSGGSNDCTTSNYSVTMNSSTGVFSGHAWASNIGWIDFAPTSGYPQLPNNGVKLVAVPTTTCASGKELSGWARALSFGSGWDGWIKFSGAAADGSHYGVCVTSDGKALGGANGRPGTDPTADSGWAWGGGNGSASDPQVVGWIQFDPSQTFVLKINQIKEITPQ